MAYYLQMNGTSDRIDVPSLTFTDFEIDCQITVIAAFKSMITSPSVTDVNSFPLQIGTDGSSHLQYKVYSSISFNSVVKPLGSTMPTTRTVFRGTMSSSGTTTSKVFCNPSNSANMTGNIYSIKFYNGATLVAWYDMNTQTVNDQSGNGKNGTLTGGTWVNDAGASPVAGGGTLTGTGSLTATGSNNISGGGALTGSGSLSASGRNTIAGSSTMTASGSLTASGSSAITGGASLTAIGSLTASGVLSMLGGAIAGGAQLTAVGRLTASGRVVTPKMIEYERRLAAARAGRRLTTVELIALQQLRKR